MKAREIMTRDPRAVTAEDTVSEAAGIMREMDVGIVPVVDDPDSRRLKGVITDRDIAVRHVAERHTSDCRVADHMSESLTKAGPDDEIEDVMDRMRQSQVRRIPVVDDDDHLIGIIAQADIAVELRPRDHEDVAKTLEAVSEPAEPTR